MGANTFYHLVRRKTYPGPLAPVNGNPNHLAGTYIDWPDAQTSFQHLCDEDRYEHGHSYSGGIGMKHDFVRIARVETDKEAEDLAYKLIDESDPRMADKWGPAGLIEITNGDSQYLFFGWASS